jgi:hypothetical protein
VVIDRAVGRRSRLMIVSLNGKSAPARYLRIGQPIQRRMAGPFFISGREKHAFLAMSNPAFIDVWPELDACCNDVSLTKPRPTAPGSA